VFHLEKVVDKELHPAWLYFDKGYADYVRADDVEVMLHNLGIGLSSKQVEALVNWSAAVILSFFLSLTYMYMHIHMSMVKALSSGALR